MINLKLKRLPKTDFKKITELPEVVFFDYDGTISDNSKYLIKAFNYALKKNFNKKKDKEVLKNIKKINKDDEKWKYIKQNCSLQIFEKCNSDYGYFLSQKKMKKVRGVLKMLKLLKKYSIKAFVVSQKDGKSLREELLKAGLLNKYIEDAYGTLDFGELQKPSLEFINEVIKQTKTKTKKKWVIGDSYSDVLTCLNMNNSKGFIIDKKDYEKITNEQKDIIGEKIFFTSYYRLIRYTKKLKRNS